MDSKGQSSITIHAAMEDPLSHPAASHRRNHPATSTTRRPSSDSGPPSIIPAGPGSGSEAPALAATLPSDPEATAAPAPDGGLRAWLQVLAAHLILINTFGYMSSFGIFQAYYTTALHRSASAISWVGSVEIFLVYFLGTASGRAVDAGHTRPVVALGSLLVVLAAAATSLASQYWQLFLAQGLCFGIGSGLLFTPIIALIATYFTRRRALAIALQASGGATGGLIFPAIAQSLLDRVGFGWTVRVMALVMLVNAVVAFLLLRPLTPPRQNHATQRRPWIDLVAFREPTYTLFTAGAFLAFWGVYIAYYYIRPYARDILHVTPRTSFNLLLVLNGVGLPGRILPGLLLAPRFGALAVMAPTVLAAGLLLYAWHGVASLSGAWAFAAVYGYLGAGVQSLMPAALSELTPPEALARVGGARIGGVFTVVSFAALSGPPIAGALVDREGGGYLGAQLFAGSAMVLGAGFLVAAKVAADRAVHSKGDDMR